MVSGSDVFPCLDTKGMHMALGMVLGGETASEPYFSTDLKPCSLLRYLQLCPTAALIFVPR